MREFVFGIIITIAAIMIFESVALKDVSRHEEIENSLRNDWDFAIRSFEGEMDELQRELSKVTKELEGIRSALEK